MTLTAFWLIAFSVLLHVSWNLLSKASKPSGAYYVITSLAATLVSLPFLWTAGIRWSALPPAFWLWFALGSVANLLYYTGLFLTYKKSDISMAYPLVRALPVLFTAVVTVLFGIGKVPSFTALAGMFVVFCGCILMPLGSWKDFRLKNYFSPVLGTVCMAAAGTTGYTIFDSIAIPMLLKGPGVSKAAACTGYMALLELIITMGLSVYLVRKEEQQAMRELLKRPWSPIISGVFTVGAYVLVLLAMPMVTNVSFVQAFRQMGLPVGVAAGVLILKEKCSAPRLAGIAAIVAGLILVAFG